MTSIDNDSQHRPKFVTAVGSAGLPTDLDKRRAIPTDN
jgi:hypothetical protein